MTLPLPSLARNLLSLDASAFVSYCIPFVSDVLTLARDERLVRRTRFVIHCVTASYCCTVVASSLEQLLLFVLVSVVVSADLMSLNVAVY